MSEAATFDQILCLCSSNKYEEVVQFAENSLTESQRLPFQFLSKLIELVLLNENLKPTLKSILNIITERCVHDDVLFALINVSEQIVDLEILECILNSFTTLFSKSKNDLYLEWCLHLARNSVVTVCQVEKEISRCSVVYLNFMKKFIKIHEPVSENNKHAFIATCLYFYGSCLLESHIGELMQCALSLTPNPLAMIPLIQYCSVNVTDRKNIGSLQCYEHVKRMSLAVFIHFSLTRKPSIHPEIYSNVYLFVHCLEIVNELLIGNFDEQSKGLELLYLNSLRCEQDLTYHYLSPLIKSIFDSISSIMIYGDSVELRKLALQGFDVLVETFDIKGQYFLFLHLRKELKHSGTLAHLIGKIKKQFEKSRHGGSNYFQGKCLFDLIKLYCFIDDNNIVMNAEKHIAALNFIWYLLFLKEKHYLHCPGLSEIQNTYLLPLKESVDAIKEECQEQFKQIEKPVDDNNMLLSLPNLSNEEKINSLMLSRNAIQLVELNLERVLQFFE